MLFNSRVALNFIDSKWKYYVITIFWWIFKLFFLFKSYLSKCYFSFGWSKNQDCSVQTVMFHWVIDSMRKVLNGASHKKAKIKKRYFISKISYLGDRQTSIFLPFFLSVSLEFHNQTCFIPFFLLWFLIAQIHQCLNRKISISKCAVYF